MFYSKTEKIKALNLNKLCLKNETVVSKVNSIEFFSHSFPC